ncbi:hypothetical protein [Fimbriiglobus ruber]|uniref:Uncharacterized protein n=1 Tax=Fimbriiglobus ruber TaxID=1908690 RepID=A0A225DAA2_9BACT|nr:hypothetical protein [Fimbriiglobus ruber]OWK38491.1 hypothetical protein FRUB_07611 [Fimbriiglobus ruber]
MIRGESGHDLTPQESKLLDKAARHSLKRGLVKATSMLEEFHRPVSPERQVRRTLELFRRTEPWTAAECADPERVQAFIQELCPLIRKKFGESDFKHHRLNDEQRTAQGLDLSRRRYNKLFRLLGRLETKLSTYVREMQKYDFTRVGKSRLATRLSWAEFAKDSATAAFVAYFAARCNLRSVFTNTPQQRPYDEIADMLFQRLERRPDRTNWWAVAHVFPDPRVLARLNDAQKGELLGRWLVLLWDIAGMLRDVWQRSTIRRDTMIVQRGNDSSTWNNTANAWNRAREAWIALLQSMGMEAELDALCFGKVLRLMAADVAYWHQLSGGGLDPNTFVWNDLPLPWEVLAGDASCTRQQVEESCHRHGVDPIKGGWVAPPPERRVEKFTPTPELVHGVAVADPALAKVLRRAGWFSGRILHQPDEVPDAVTVRRNEHGFATGVDQGNIESS